MSFTMASLFVRTEKETAISFGITAANIYGCFGAVLGLQLESMMILLCFLIEFRFQEADAFLQFFDCRQLLLDLLYLDIVV